MVKKSKKETNTCPDCTSCRSCKWLLPIVILAVALVPGWYTTTWGKWAIIISAAILLLKRWCPACMCTK